MLALLLLSLFVWRVTDLGDLLSFSKKKKSRPLPKATFKIKLSKWSMTETAQSAYNIEFLNCSLVTFTYICNKETLL